VSGRDHDLGNAVAHQAGTAHEHVSMRHADRLAATLEAAQDQGPSATAEPAVVYARGAW
jgi:hypothetical protein